MSLPENNATKFLFRSVGTVFVPNDGEVTSSAQFESLIRHFGEETVFPCVRSVSGLPIRIWEAMVYTPGGSSTILSAGAALTQFCSAADASLFVPVYVVRAEQSALASLDCE